MSAPPDTPRPPTSARPETFSIRVLVAYFSRPGENYFYGGRIDLETGNTQVVAEMIGDAIDVDMYRIEATAPYPEDYEETVAWNVREQDRDAWPAIANPLPNLDGYDTVLLGSPIWNLQEPMIMRTFLDGASLLPGKTVHPFVTYAVSGMGRADRDYAALCPDATIGEGLAVQGERAGDARPTVQDWLHRIELLTR